MIVLTRLTSVPRQEDLAELTGSQSKTDENTDLSGERRYKLFAAYDGDKLVGLLRASFDSDFAGNVAFEGFDLPAGPHGFVSAIDVHPTYRRQGIGKALLLEYARAAEAVGCTFLGGSIDLTTDDMGRRAFFTECGFDTNAWDNFGQTTAQLFKALTPRW